MFPVLAVVMRPLLTVYNVSIVDNCVVSIVDSL
jgi:hypothetical protein